MPESKAMFPKPATESASQINPKASQTKLVQEVRKKALEMKPLKLSPGMNIPSEKE